MAKKEDLIKSKVLFIGFGVNDKIDRFDFDPVKTYPTKESISIVKELVEKYGCAITSN